VGDRVTTPLAGQSETRTSRHGGSERPGPLGSRQRFQGDSEAPGDDRARRAERNPDQPTRGAHNRPNAARGCTAVAALPWLHCRGSPS
jgi:hypothetical protein